MLEFTLSEYLTDACLSRLMRIPSNHNQQGLRSVSVFIFRVTALIGVLIYLSISPTTGQVAQAPEFDEITKIEDAFKKGYLLVSGYGVGGEAYSHPSLKREMAFRAASAAAYRELSVILQGMKLSSKRTNIDMAGTDDIVKIAIKGNIKGAHIISKYYDKKDDIAKVYVKISIKGIGSLTESLLSQIRDIPPLPGSKLYSLELHDKSLLETKVYDGLVIDVTKYPFHPALVNRIVTKQGEIIYDPSKIAQDILVERGSGDYTTDTDKAKMILLAHNVHRPLIIKAIGLKENTNVEISKDDAILVFTSNHQTNFLEKARVVFVLK